LKRSEPKATILAAPHGGGHSVGGQILLANSAASGVYATGSELRLFARGWERRGRLFKGDRTSLFSLIQRLGLKALGRRISPKHFRHGKAYHLVKVKGVHPAIAARALGHASLGSILSYVHPTEQDLREALQD
jgi:integrase